MGIGKGCLCIILPPLAVTDKGCGTVMVIFVLTLCGWVPGAIGALIVCSNAAR